ncbi:hypothetical protein C6P46_004113 [Rhodotorula mucilaginosa]|uniref:Uncharacterized protein n=1 Tax=Rhodotorula mucilaginosa TaxID=5537 RepID=A0A9P6W338_RHOMI|nr:hypothetical protein C6P46_004113 [Rhodotorula mucilaginosa]
MIKAIADIPAIPGLSMSSSLLWSRDAAANLPPVPYFEPCVHCLDYVLFGPFIRDLLPMPRSNLRAGSIRHHPAESRARRMPRPTSAQILASQLEQAMAFYATKDSSPPSSSSGAASSSTQTLAPPQPPPAAVSSSSSQSQSSQSGNGTAKGAKERNVARSGSLSRLPPLPAHSLERPPLALETARSVPLKDDDDVLPDDDDDDELAEFGYGRRNRGPKKESLLDILNSEPPPWMNQPASSSSFSLDPVAVGAGESKSSSSLTSKLRRRLRASTTTNRSHGDLVSEGSGGRGGGGAVGLTTLRNSKSSTNLLLGSLGRKARPSGGGGGGRARANTGSSKSSPKTRAPHEFHDPSLPPRPPQMLPFDLTPLLITPMIANIAPTRTAAAAQTSGGKEKQASKSTTRAETPNDSTRHLHENGLLEDPKRKRDASFEEEVLAAAGTSDAHDDFSAPVQKRQDTFSISENSMSRPSESDQQPASSGTSSDVTAPSSSKNNSPDRDRSSTRSPSERTNSSPRRPVPEPLRTRTSLAELPPLRADSDESIISYASIQKSPTRGPMPRRISRKPTSSPSGTLAASSYVETRPAATVRDAQVIDRAAEWTLSPTEDAH